MIRGSTILLLCQTLRAQAQVFQRYKPRTQDRLIERDALHIDLDVLEIVLDHGGEQVWLLNIPIRHCQHYTFLHRTRKDQKEKNLHSGSALSKQS